MLTQGFFFPFQFFDIEKKFTIFPKQKEDFFSSLDHKNLKKLPKLSQFSCQILHNKKKSLCFFQCWVVLIFF
jgi:hypothetical protein